MVEPKSKKANYVRKHAPDFCHIWFVCKGRLIYTRKGTKQPSPDVEGRASNSETNQSDAGILSQELDSRLRLLDFGGYDGSSDEFDQLSRVSFLQSSTRSTEFETASTSPHLSLAMVEVREPHMGLLPLPQTQNEHLGPSPPSVLQESSINDDLYNKLEQAWIETEDSRREAFEESLRHQRAEKEAMEAIRKAKAAERLYLEELRQTKDKEEELAKLKEAFKCTKSHWDKVSKELYEALDQKLSLESQIEKSNLIINELEEKILSAVDLLQYYKNERDELQIERDHALRAAEELRKQLSQGPSSSHFPVFFAEFSFSDLEKATNYFDPSLKIGEGGYGSIYKGLLRHIEVAIKMLNPKSTQGPREFETEVNVLSKLRHPNLVTLIGVCPESCALIYEYLPGGSLEDHLSRKDNTPTLPWQTRIQIARDLCSVLIFLHSSRPSSIIHGDLKPANILLDGNFLCKLGDFGVCHVISRGEMEVSMDETTRFFTTEPQGTNSYMDPEFLATRELTPKSDVYSFGIILLRLLTGKPARGIVNEVEYALDKGSLSYILDPSARDWPFVQAEQLARIALRCCDMNGRSRPDLASDIWRTLESMKGSCQHLLMLQLASENQAPPYFRCPISLEIMEDPHIASDGFTYEAEAFRGWLDEGKDTSPMTNIELANHNLIPNRALRSAIQEWQQHQRNV